MDCSCTSRGCCSGADQNKSGDALQPLNLDAQLQANFAFDSLYTAKGMRSLTMNRVPGRGDGTNCESEALRLSIRSLVGPEVQMAKLSSGTRLSTPTETLRL